MADIKVLGQYIKDFSFEIPGAPQIFSQIKTKPDLNVSIDLDAHKLPDGNYEVSLKISAESKVEDKKFFICEIVYAGIFAITQIEDDNLLEQILLIQCPNLLFPFVRRIITNATSDGGISPLMLDPINFVELYNRRKKVSESTPISSRKN